MTDTPFAPIIRTQADLEDAWQQLMGPWGYGGTSVWLMLVSDDRPLPQLTEITECDEPPTAEATHNLAEVLRMLVDEFAPDGRVAFLRSRPGAAATTELDRAWATALYDAARAAGVRCEVVHVATRGSIRPLPLDDIGLVDRPA